MPTRIRYKGCKVRKTDAFIKFSYCYVDQGQASGMDGTLKLIFAISETIRDSKKFIK